MRAGIFAKTFAGGSLEAALDGVARCGVQALQFNLALTGGSSLPASMPAALAARVRDAVAARGLDMVAVSGTYNMAHPDPAARARGQAALATLIAAAPALGTRVVTICTGTRDPADMWRAHPDNDSAAAWSDALASIRAAVAVAEAHDVVLGFEPEHANVVADAEAGRRLLDEIGSPHLRVVLDAANLVAPAGLDRQAETLERAFALLGDAIVLAHAKDVAADGTVVAAGRGGLDYAAYVGHLRRAGYTGSVVLHGLAPAEAQASVAFLEAHLGAR